MLAKFSYTMKYFFSLAFFLAFYTATAQFKIMSYNIRYDNAGDSINQWSNRKEKMNALLKKYKPDVACFQEALYNQVNDLQMFLPDFNYCGVGRDDGKKKGEFSPIFYNKAKFAFIEGTTFWLSETPNVPGSKGWDAAITRICTYVKLKEKRSGKIVVIFNTHFDHIGDTARLMSAKLILEKIRVLAKKSPVILAGDFNSEPEGKAYIEIINSKNPKLTDSFVLNDKNSTCTFTGFAKDGGICKRIDYIFYSKHLSTSHFLIADDNDGKYYVSDHLPVMVEVKWK